MNDDEKQEEAIEAGVTAAAEELSGLAGKGRRWRAWGEKEMLIATTAALAAVQKWQQLQKQREDA